MAGVDTGYEAIGGVLVHVGIPANEQGFECGDTSLGEGEILLKPIVSVVAVRILSGEQSGTFGERKLSDIRGNGKDDKKLIGLSW